VVKLSADATRLAVQIPFPSDDPYFFEPDKMMVQFYHLGDERSWRQDGAPIPDQRLLDMSRNGRTATTLHDAAVTSYLHTGLGRFRSLALDEGSQNLVCQAKPSAIHSM
jgi:hypothetical protein